LLFVGDDWAEDYHDVEVQYVTGRRLAKARFTEGLAGVAGLHELVAQHLDEDEADQVVLGIETDRGLWVLALIAAGYGVFAINPLQVARYASGRVSPVPRATRRTRTSWPTWCGLTLTSCVRSRATATRPKR